MECKFVVGQKVTPLKGARWHDLNHENDFPQPVFGEAYTVHGLHLYSGMIFIRLAELLGGAYHHKGFKPVQSTDTGMTILRGLLQPRKCKVREDA